MQEYKAKRGDGSRDKRVDLAYRLIGESHQLFHQFLTQFSSRWHIAHARSAAKAVVQVVLFVTKRGSFIEGVGDGAVLQLHQVILSQQPAFVSLA